MLILHYPLSMASFLSFTWFLVSTQTFFFFFHCNDDFILTSENHFHPSQHQPELRGLGAPFDRGHINVTGVVHAAKSSSLPSRWLLYLASGWSTYSRNQTKKRLQGLYLNVHLKVDTNFICSEVVCNL